MSLEKFLSLSAIVLGFIGTVFLLKGVLRMTPDVIGEIGLTRWDYSIPVLENLSVQKADTICGFIFIVIAFSLQLVQTLFNLSAIRLIENNLSSYILMLFFILIISALLLSIDFSLRKHNRIEAGKSITRSYVKRHLLKENNLDLSRLSSVESYSSKLLYLKREKNETDEEFLLRLGPIINIDFRSYLKINLDIRS